MNAYNLPQTVLLVFGIIMLIKAVWGILHPSSIKQVADWWSRAILKVNTLCAILYMIIAVGIWISVVLDQPMTNRILVLCGAFFLWAGTLALKPQDFKRFIKRMAADRGIATIRIISLASLFISLFLIWIAHKGL